MKPTPLNDSSHVVHPYPVVNERTHRTAELPCVCAQSGVLDRFRALPTCGPAPSGETMRLVAAVGPTGSRCAVE